MGTKFRYAIRASQPQIAAVVHTSRLCCWIWSAYSKCTRGHLFASEPHVHLCKPLALARLEILASKVGPLSVRPPIFFASRLYCRAGLSDSEPYSNLFELLALVRLWCPFGLLGSTLL